MKVVSLVSRLLIAAAVIACGSRAYSQSPQELFFDARVRPLLVENCSTGHGEESTAGLRVGSTAGLLQGGSRDPSIVPGDPAASLLVLT